MSVDQLTYTGNLVAASCWCGIHLAIPDSLYRQARNNGHPVYCPLGHEFVWKETETDRLRKRAEAAEKRAQATRDLLRAEERSHAATRGHLTRVRKRVQIQNLERHMKTKHPEEVAS